MSAPEAGPRKPPSYIRPEVFYHPGYRAALHVLVLRSDAPDLAGCHAPDCPRLVFRSPRRVEVAEGGALVPTGLGVKIPSGFVGVLRKACADPNPSSSVDPTRICHGDLNQVVIRIEGAALVYEAGDPIAELELQLDSPPVVVHARPRRAPAPEADGGDAPPGE